MSILDINGEVAGLLNRMKIIECSVLVCDQ